MLICVSKTPRFKKKTTLSIRGSIYRMIINPQLLFCFRNPVLLSWRASLRQPSWSWIWKSASSVGWLGATHRPAQQAACLWRLSSAVCQLRLESKADTVSSAFASSWQAMRHSPLAAPKRKLFLIQQQSPSSSKAWALQRKHSHGLSLLQGWTIAIAIQLLTLPMLQQSQLDIPPLRPFAPSIRPCLSISERPSLHYESSRRDSENCQSTLSTQASWFYMKRSTLSECV